MKSKLLLHMCCAGCTPHILEDLRKGYEVTGYWYNPNIHPREEYDRRLGAVKSFAEKSGLKLIINGEFNQENWIAGARRISVVKPKRCVYCWEMRIRMLSETALVQETKYIATTLQASPYQDFNIIQDSGREIARRHGLIFVSKDHRENYRSGVKKVRDMGLYTQKYCGCVFSREERIMEKNTKSR